MSSTTFVSADTTAEDYARRTGLTPGAGFVMEKGRPSGLYPTPMALRVIAQLEGVTVHAPTARTYKEARRALRHLTDYAPGVAVLNREAPQ